MDCKIRCSNWMLAYTSRRDTDDINCLSSSLLLGVLPAALQGDDDSHSSTLSIFTPLEHSIGALHRSGGACVVLAATLWTADGVMAVDQSLVLHLPSSSAIGRLAERLHVSDCV